MNTGQSGLRLKHSGDSQKKGHCRAKSLIGMALAILSLCPCGSSQSNPSLPQGAPPPDSDPGAITISKRVDEVDVVFTAWTRSHSVVSDLSAQDVEVFDNSKVPSSIVRFESSSDLPLRIGILIDRSDSVSKRFAFEKEFASSLLERLLNPKQDLGFVIAFNDRPDLTQDLTADVPSLTDALHDIPNGGATAIYDAVLRACQLMESRNDSSPSRRVMILITDGDDNQSQAKEKEALEAAIRANAFIFVVFTGYADDFAIPSPYAAMEKLAKSTGGQILSGDNKSRLQKAFERIENVLRSQYMIAYKPPEGFVPDGSYRKIKITSKRHGVHLFYRHGYYSRRSGE